MDQDDIIFRSKREKYNAVIEQVTTLSKAGRPVLIGTTSVEISELLGKMLGIRKRNVRKSAKIGHAQIGRDKLGPPLPDISKGAPDIKRYAPGIETIRGLMD